MLKVLGKIFIHRLKIVLQYKYLLFIIFFMSMLFSLLRINLNNKSRYSSEEKEFKLTVASKKVTSGRYSIILKGKEKIILYTESFPYDIGDIVFVKGELESIKNNTIPNNFNYRIYLQSREIYWQLKIGEIKLVKQNSSLYNKIKNKIISKIESNNYKEYLYAFLLGDTSYFNSETRNKYQLIGLSYILAIGSFQVMMIINLLNLIENRLKIKRNKRIIINIIIIILYILFTNKIIGVLRSGLCYILKTILDYFKIRVKNYNIIILVGIILLFINPYYINNIGFLYSFSISIAVSLLRKRIKGNYYKRLWYISFIAFVVSLPITIYSNYEINFLAIFFSFLLLPVFNFLVFPLCIIVFIFPFLSFIFTFVISFLEYIVNIFSKISFLTFVFKKSSMILSFVYYFLIVLLFKNKRFILIFIIVLFMHININKFVKESIITFLDVKQGDSIVIKNSNDLVLIDTGSSYYGYSENIIKYIKSLGISKINELIISHGDFDHMGEAINLVNNFKVEKVIFNCGEFNDLEKKLVKVLNKKHIKYYSCIKELNIDDNKLYFLQTKEYDNENDNSNVIYTELNGYKFMFMGDAGVEKEKDILEKYNLSNIDVLKVGHHGSKTSSGKEFIDEINPKYSVISVGKNNRYGHPNKEVLDTLQDSKIYRTDQDGSIMFKIKNNKLKIETCSP